MTEHSLFAALSHIPPAVVARVARNVPEHIDREDLLGAANEALLATIRRHSSKEFDDIAKLSWKRCAGAVKDELRATVQIRGARRRGVRATVVSIENLPPDALAYSPPEPPMLLSAVQRALEELPPRYQRVVFGRTLGQLDSETAKELGVSEPRVSQIYANAILKMQSELRR